MSLSATRQHTRGQPRGPERFRVPEGGYRAPVWRCLLSAVVLVAVVAGVPVLLVLTAGLPPVPQGPDLSVLTRAVTVGTLVDLLVWAAWLAWLQFTVCTVVEAASALRGRGVPRHLPLSGLTQSVVRRLVVSTLLLTSLGTVAGPVVAAAPQPSLPAVAAADSGAAASASGAAEEAAASGQEGETGQPQEGVRYMVGDVELDPGTGAELVGQRVYVVQPPQGRYHDNLWDIAERTLGEGRAYSQVYELNAGREQPDGRRLELARLIQPGWLLVMPESAQTVDRVVAVPVREQAPPAPSQRDGASQGQGAGAREGAGRPDGADGMGGSGGAASADDVAPARIPAVGGLLAAALVGLLARRRRLGLAGEVGQDAAELERLLRVGADAERSRRLDAVLRGLGGLSPVPRPYAVVLSDESCLLHLPRPLPEAPAPWQVRNQGLTWVLPAGQEPEPGAAPPLVPGLVTIGRDSQGADVLIDLASADGDICVTGDPAMAAEVVGALALELCTNPWSSQVVVAGAGLPPTLHDMLGGRLHSPEDLVRGSRAPGGDPVLSGPRPGAVNAVMLVAGGEALPPLPPGGRTALVCTGTGSGSRWRIEVDASGSARIDPLGLVVTATRATGEEVAALAELLAPAPVDSTRPPVPDPPRPPVDAAALRAAPVRVHVLGRTLVEAAGPVERRRRSLLTEAAVCVALHPQGVRPDALAAMLWPLGVTGDVVEATVERLRRWLGHDVQGVPHLRQDAQGRLVMGPGVVTDWDVLRCLLGSSRSSPPGREAALLREALRLVHGPVGQDAPAGRYSWLARVRVARQVESLVVDAAHRLVVLIGDSVPDAAAEAVDRGLRVVDLSQVLWRDRLRLAARRGDEELRCQVDALLDAAGAEDLALVDPATAALVEDLAPGLGVRREPA
ncbi:LysM peptidoglycan-binding domain-containing protein [Actinomyces wuliandei]|uniref:LysM peptidoglycan-binding domain-containing protein n=1 Tax=Actinomyces wuliandei TaxID=2057743 RepID=UPI001117D0AC|nr:hypothetical protein [Actinomyces wuliandei]